MADQRATAVYTCHHIDSPITIDGRLDKAAWAQAPKTPRFGQMGDGRVTLFDTRAAMLWDDTYFYVAFWLEEHDIWSTQLEDRNGLTWQENTVEVFIAGSGAYYNLSLNPMRRTSEMFFIWKDAYIRGGRYDVPEFDLAVHRAMVFGGDAGPHDPRGMRWGFRHWRFPGMQTAVQVDGTLNERHDIDRGWTAEIAFPWEGMQRLADDSVPPRDGETWRIGLARHEVIDQRVSRHTAVWTWQPMGTHDMHTPDRYPEVVFSK